MKDRSAAFLLFLLCAACAKVPQKPLDLTSSDPGVAFICDGIQTSTGPLGVRKVKAQALIYPNADPRSIEVALTGQFRMRTLCAGDAECQVDRSRDRIHISVKPGTATRPDPGYTESFTFDQSTRELQFGAGGMDGESVFVGKCESKPGLR